MVLTVKIECAVYFVIWSAIFLPWNFLRSTGLGSTLHICIPVNKKWKYSENCCCSKYWHENGITERVFGELFLRCFLLLKGEKMKMLERAKISVAFYYQPTSRFVKWSTKKIPSHCLSDSVTSGPGGVNLGRN